MKYAVIENGLITNVVESEADFATENGWIEFPEFIDGKPVGIGWTYENGVFTAPAEPTPVTPIVPTKEQLLAELQALTAKINALS